MLVCCNYQTFQRNLAFAYERNKNLDAVRATKAWFTQLGFVDLHRVTSTWDMTICVKQTYIHIDSLTALSSY